MTEISARKNVEHDRTDVAHLFDFQETIRNQDGSGLLFKNIKFGLKWVEPTTTPPDKVFERLGL